MRAITAKYPGKCEKCGGAIEPGFKIFWHGKGRVSHAHAVTCNEVYAAAEADKAEAAAVAGNHKAWAEALAALGAGVGDADDGEAFNAWVECEGHNPWAKDLVGDPGTLVRLAYEVDAAAGNEAALKILREAWAVGRAAIKVANAAA